MQKKVLLLKKSSAIYKIQQIEDPLRRLFFITSKKIDDINEAFAGKSEFSMNSSCFVRENFTENCSISKSNFVKSQPLIYENLDESPSKDYTERTASIPKKKKGFSVNFPGISPSKPIKNVSFFCFAEKLALKGGLWGVLEITSTGLYYRSCMKETRPNIKPFKFGILAENLMKEDYYKRWKHNSISEIHVRYYNSLRNSFEIFMKKGKTHFFIVHCPHTLQELFHYITNQNKTIKKVKNGIKTLKNEKLQQKWLDSEISNFEYLMKLNTFSGRTYHDPNQYPVFPWILIDFSSKFIDFSASPLEIYRDLKKPIGALNESRLNYLKNRMKQMEKDKKIGSNSYLKPFLYGSHYSSSAQILYYLIRLEPVASLCQSLQSGKFDCTDRLFFDISETWKSSLTFQSDFKELIPEFYYNAEFLKNRSRFEFGSTQNGVLVNDVILPPWAKSPEEFVFRNRQALEEKNVSEMLSHWIDLIFGYKQRGEEAIKADNLFFYMTYQV